MTTLCGRSACLEPRSSRCWACNCDDNGRPLAAKPNVRNYGRTVRGNQSECEVNCPTQWAIRVIAARSRDGTRLSATGSAHPYAEFAWRMDVGKCEKGLR